MAVKLLLKILLMATSFGCVNSAIDCICFENLATELITPIVLHEPLDGTGRLFVVTWGGIIYIYYKDGRREETPFLDISDKVVVGGEKGLVGFVTHPKFEENRRFYVYYVTPDPLRLRLSQFRAMINNPNIADPDSEVVMIELEKRTGIHHAGEVGVKGVL